MPAAPQSGPVATGWTPTQTQRAPDLAGRRRVVAVLNLAVYAGLLWWLAGILGAGGWSLVDIAIFICFAIAAPWSVLGVCNALIGVWLLHGVRDGIERVAPYARLADPQAPLTTRTAVLMTIRSEDPVRAMARFDAVRRSLEATGEGAHFDWFVLSDTPDGPVATAEARAVEAWRATTGLDPARIIYRRRSDNAGFKAGNLRDFCERWGAGYEFMLPLDVDSLMDGATILRMVRIAQAHPALGILQSLVVGAPSQSAFARIFQFGMRHGMRPYTMGASWWTGDCGPFWGHNAIVRIAPFTQYCDLPTLPNGRSIMSHDQIEAVLMRRAGFEVRVLPEECGSYEENPPTLLEFTRRDLRWCQGNMQYWPLLRLPGLLPTSRFQLVWAIMMFIGIPAWTAIIALAALKPLDGEDMSAFPAASAAGLYIVFLLFYLAPKLAGFLDIALTPGGLARYGGGLRFATGAISEIVFSFLLGAATTLRTGLFMIGMLFGRTVIWNGQARDAHALSFATAAEGLWPQLAFGLALYALALAFAPSLILWSLPLTLGYLVAIPFAMATAEPAAGLALQRMGLCDLPEDIAPPALLLSVQTLAREQANLARSTASTHEPA